MSDANPLPLPPSARLLSTSAGSRYLGLGEDGRLLSQYAELGLIPTVRLGGVASKRPRVLFDVRDLDAFIDAMKAAGSVDALLGNTPAVTPAKDE
ncbi:MAG: hypothetical protein KDA63_00565 [Planctomycetales bacterium]|nr:hypothetical protein [Planctomycetales bacterium]